MFHMATALRRQLRKAFVTFAMVAFTSTVNAQGCSIVYGSDWAFLSLAPNGWTSSCGTKGVAGTAITLLPADIPPDQTDGFIYVTVSTKDLPTLHAFALDEQERFKQSVPDLQILPVRERDPIVALTYELNHVAGSSDGREELIAYVDGPTAFYIIVLNARSSAALAKYQASFRSYLTSFVPMRKG